MKSTFAPVDDRNLIGRWRGLGSIQKTMRIFVDVLVTSVGKVREWGDLTGTILYEALHEGKVVYEFS